MGFDAIQVPLFNSEGGILNRPPSSWQITFNQGNLLLVSGDVTYVLRLSDVIAMEAEEQQQRAMGKTIGRMALTGVGAALFSKGRRGGMGAGLLDLSARGVETKSVIVGTLVFPTTATIRFSLSAKQFAQLAPHISQHTITEEAAESARQLFDMCERMKRDGRRAVEELAQRLVEHHRQIEALHRQADEGATFSDRDGARQQVAVLED